MYLYPHVLVDFVLNLPFNVEDEQSGAHPKWWRVLYIFSGASCPCARSCNTKTSVLLSENKQNSSEAQRKGPHTKKKKRKGGKKKNIAATLEVSLGG